ncbi:MAG TPA: hypothetical protein VIK20_00295 [Bacteroidales bacterium]
MKDFLFVIPDSWSSFSVGPLPVRNALKVAGKNAYFGLEGCKQENPQAGQLEMVIDFSDCHFRTGAFEKTTFINAQINAVDFHYYFHVDCPQRKIVVSSCLFSILPIYYYQGNNATFISNRAGLIVETIGKTWKVNTKFLVEQALFNYSFQNETIYEGIKLLPANCLLTLDNSLRIENYFNISDHYCSEPTSIKDSIEPLRDLFIAESDKYFSIDKSALSFTSGYDGRTLLACSRFHKHKFATYSFGARDNDDIIIPQATARKLNIPFQAMIFDEDYAENDFFHDGVELMDLTDGNNNFLQVHHLYSAKRLAKDHDCLLNGMFGSELFRALHISGQVTSKELVSLFMLDSVDELLAALKNSPKLNYFNKEHIADPLDQVMEEVIRYKSETGGSGQDKNQQFYSYIFAEAFRKYFGAIIAPQLKYINVRSPFLNLIFIKELLKSELAGVNNEFFTHNPLKRFKGQLLYAKIIEKTDKELFREKTTKNYSPKDLLTLLGRARVAYGYFKKKLVRKVGPRNLNNLMIISGMERNKERFKCDFVHSFFAIGITQQLLESSLRHHDRDLIVQSLGMINFINNKKEKFYGNNSPA